MSPLKLRNNNLCFHLTTVPNLFLCTVTNPCCLLPRDHSSSPFSCWYVDLHLPIEIRSVYTVTHFSFTELDGSSQPNGLRPFPFWQLWIQEMYGSVACSSTHSVFTVWWNREKVSSLECCSKGRCSQIKPHSCSFSCYLVTWFSGSLNFLNHCNVYWAVPT